MADAVAPAIPAFAVGSRRLGFDGTGLQLAGWMLLSIPSVLLVVPLAWFYAAMGRWLCRNLKFPNGAAATFHGEGGEVWGWTVLYGLAIIAQAAASIALNKQPFYASLLVNLAFAAALCAIGLQILKWFCSRVEVSSVGRLRFTGQYGAFVGWTVLIQISIYTVIGWAWATAGAARWQCRHIEGQGLRFRFDGKGHHILWRGFVAVLGSILIVTMPWLMMWLMRWFIEQVEVEGQRGTA